MRILVVAAKVDSASPRFADAVAVVRTRVGDRADVVSPSSETWERVRAAEGGWKGLPRWAVREFDALVVLETERGGLGRGTFDVAVAFLTAAKPVAVVRGGQLLRVHGVGPTGEGDWKEYWGQCVVELGSA